MFLFLLAYPAGHFVTVHTGQMTVEQDQGDVLPMLLHRRQGRHTVFDYQRAIAQLSELQLDGLAVDRMVFDHQNLLPGCDRLDG